MNTIAYVTLLAAAMATPAAWAQDFSFGIVERNALRLETARKSPVIRRESDLVSESLSGAEDLGCGKGRQSAAAAKADVANVTKRADGLSFSILASATTQGGHVRNCVGPISTGGTDTTAHASAQSVADVAINFSADAAPAPYFVDVVMSSVGQAAKLRMLGPGGREIPVGESGSFAVEAQPGAAYLLQVTADSASANKGECCHEDSAASATVDVSLRKAPLLMFMQDFEPLIAGGEETDDYPSVGALLIDGQMHCTATVVGQQTLLTAAHCLQGYESQREKFTFVTGGTVAKPSAPPVRVVQFDYPKGANGESFAYNPKTYEDDIGVAYLEQPTALPLMALHQGDPTWNIIHGGKTKLVFVGYGYDVVSGQKVNAGVKRFAEWEIHLVENRRVGFDATGASTCKGDSGGPALLVKNAQATQVGVTSTGTKDCRRGYETRVDTYAPWLQGRIR